MLSPLSPASTKWNRKGYNQSMSFRVLIVPDKFKGTLTAQAAANLIAQGWRAVRPGDSPILLPMSDGGDGFGDVLASLLNVQARHTRSVDAAHRPCEVKWALDQQSGTAIVESAKVIGLALLPPGQYHPFDLDTYGLGAVLQEARAQSEQLLIGIGGSATNDGGFGMARALGWVFIDDQGKDIIRWTDLARLSQIRPPKGDQPRTKVLVAVDVQNPLLGPTGASRVYGPQKGLRPRDFALAEECLGRLAEVVERGVDAASEPGAGAAGGLGFGLRAFLAASLESGFDLFARYARLEEKIRAADLVITGEGAIDASTLMGKGVGEVARLCRKHAIPCLGLAGTLTAVDERINPFKRLYGMAPNLTSIESAKSEADVWLPRLASTAAREWS